jgi:hypothetical protein
MDYTNAIASVTITPWEMAAIVIVMIGGLASWIILMFRADRPTPRTGSAAQPNSVGETIPTDEAERMGSTASATVSVTNS